MSVIEFIKDWRQPGEPWSMYLVVPVVGLVLLAGLPIIILVHYSMKLLGVRDGLFY